LNEEVARHRSLTAKDDLEEETNPMQLDDDSVEDKAEKTEASVQEFNEK